MSKNVAISVIIATYNQAEYLKTAVDSILDQTFKDFELIIINDGSTDNTHELLEEYKKKDSRIKVINNPKNYGVAKAFNIGHNNAVGKYIAMMGSDDYSFPERLKLQYNFLENNDDYVICGSYINVANKDLDTMYVRKYPTDHEDIINILKRITSIEHASVMYKKQASIDAGLYNENFSCSVDYDLLLRLTHYGKFANLNDVLVTKRFHENSLTGSKIHTQSKIALYTKIKAIMEYNIDYTFKDKMFLILHGIGIFLIPSKLKFLLFNFYRRYINKYDIR